MEEVKVELNNDSFGNSGYIALEQIKLEIEEEKNTIKEQHPSCSNFRHDQNLPKEDDSCTSEPSTSAAVGSNDQHLKVFTKMCEDLPRLLRKVHKNMGDLNGDCEIPRDRLLRRIEDEYLAEFDKKTKEKYRCWFDEEGWQSVIESQIEKFFENSTKVDNVTGLKVIYLQKIQKKRKESTLATAKCIVCNKRKNRKKMKILPTSTSIRKAYRERLGPEIAARMDKNARICFTHFPKGEYVPYKHILPCRVGEEPSDEKELVDKSEQLSSNPSRLGIQAKIRAGLPKILQKICNNMKEVEIPRKQLFTLIEEKCTMGMTEPQKTQCQRWFKTVLWKTSIQTQIDVFFENVKRKDAKTGFMVDYVRKPLSREELVPVAPEITDYRKKRRDVLMRMREGLSDTVRYVFENMAGYEFPRKDFYRLLVDKFMTDFNAEEKSRYEHWFHEPAWRSFIRQHVHVYFDEIGKKTNAGNWKNLVFFLRKKFEYTEFTSTIPSNTYHILLRSNEETNRDKILSTSDIALREFIKSISKNTLEADIDRMLHRRSLMIDEMRKMIEEHFCLVFMASQKPIIVRKKTMDFDEMMTLNLWDVGYYGADEETCLFHNAIEFYRYFFHTKCTLIHCHSFSEFLNDIKQHTAVSYLTDCQQDASKEGSVLFEHALEKFLDLATMKLSGMERIDPKPEYMPECEGIYNIPTAETIKSTVQKMRKEMKSEIIKKREFQQIFEENVSNYWKLHNFSDPRVLFSDLQDVFENMIAMYFISEDDSYRKIVKKQQQNRAHLIEEDEEKLS